MEKLTPFKEMSSKDKISYIWDYWKIPIIIAVLAVLILPGTIKSIITKKDPDLAVIMINSKSKDPSVFKDLVSSHQENDFVALNANLGFSEDGSPTGFYLDDTVLSAQLNSQTYDLFLGNGEKYIFCANDGYLIDLSTVLSKDILNSIPKDHLLYTTVGDRIEAYPCAILLDNCKKLESYYPNESVYCGIVYNNPNPELAAQIIEDLLVE